MRRIIPHLWFDKEAVEAAHFYVDVFGGAIDHVGQLHDTPPGDCDIVGFTLADHPFMAISGGPAFRPNPSISFLVNFDPARGEDAAGLDAMWRRLADGGKVLMELGEYPFSKRYGWVEDRYGFSWQLMLTNPEGEPRPRIIPFLLFTRGQSGRADEAIDLYTEALPDARRGQTVHYPSGMEPNVEGTVMFADFQVGGQWLAAVDGGDVHQFGFNEAVSLLVECDDQAEMDRLSDALSAVPEAEQCGWIKDRFGVSWQIAPALLMEMMRDGTTEQVDRMTQAVLPMKRLDLVAIEAAFNGIPAK